MKPKSIAYLVVLSLTVAAAAAVLGFSAFQVLAENPGYQWLILAYLTILSGAFTFELKAFRSQISAADTFIFVNAMLFGPAVGALTAALDGLLATVRLDLPLRKKTAVALRNISVMAISVFAGAQAFFLLLGSGPLVRAADVGIGSLALALAAAAAALVYFLSNSVLVAGLMSLRGAGSMFRIWREGFLKTSVLFMGSAALGALLAFAIRTITPLTLLFIVPALVTVYFIEKMYLAPNTLPAGGSAESRPAYRRYHYFIVALGLGFIALLLKDVLLAAPGRQWMLLAVLALLTGFITVRIPAIKIKFSLGDTFVFANLILFGPVVGAVTAALDGFAGSLRCKTRERRFEFMIFNVTAMAMAAYAAGEIFFWLLGRGPLYSDPKLAAGQFFLPTTLLGIGYYLLNATGVALIVALQARERLSRVWSKSLLWGTATATVSALGAIFVAASVQAVTPVAAAATLLLLGVIYISYRAFTEPAAAW